MLGGLHTLDATSAASAGGIGVGDGAVVRPGGAWHHLADGLPSAEIAAASRMLAGAAPPHPPRLVGVHGTDNAGGGHDSRVGDEGPDRDDRDPDPRGGDGPLISRWPPNVTLMARAGHDYGGCSAP